MGRDIRMAGREAEGRGKPQALAGSKRKAPVGMEEALLLGLCAPAAKRRIRRSVRRFAVVPGGRSSRLGGGL